jgi:hypothetical protein
MLVLASAELPGRDPASTTAEPVHSCSIALSMSTCVPVEKASRCGKTAEVRRPNRGLESSLESRGTEERARALKPSPSACPEASTGGDKCRGVERPTMEPQAAKSRAPTASVVLALAKLRLLPAFVDSSLKA